MTKETTYRLHGPLHPDQPPKDKYSTKGREAHAADGMVKQAHKMARWAEQKKAAWYMENPVGSLACRPYQRRWLLRAGKRMVRREVHYCAYRHVYNKPTHIWTNMTGWKPKGTTGTGKCECKCEAGEVGSKGKWIHRYKLAQASSQAKSGKESKAWKNMVPA